jgi:Helix-turn-helix domain
MKEKVEMSIGEAERLSIMRQIDKKILTIRKGGEELGLSTRQIKRIRKRYLAEGEKGLISQKRGKESNRKISNRLRHAKVQVRWREGQPIEVWHNTTRLDYNKWDEVNYEQPVVQDSKEIALMKCGTKRQKPNKHHPWR